MTFLIQRLRSQNTAKGKVTLQLLENLKHWEVKRQCRGTLSGEEKVVLEEQDVTQVEIRGKKSAAIVGFYVNSCGLRLFTECYTLWVNLFQPQERMAASSFVLLWSWYRGKNCHSASSLHLENPNKPVFWFSLSQVLAALFWAKV